MTISEIMIWIEAQKDKDLTEEEIEMIFDEMTDMKINKQ